MLYVKNLANNVRNGGPLFWVAHLRDYKNGLITLRDFVEFVVYE